MCQTDDKPFADQMEIANHKELNNYSLQPQVLGIMISSMRMVLNFDVNCSLSITQ